MTNLLQIAGVDVFVDGDGPEAIVMIHGWPDTYRVWDAQVDALKAHYRCVRFTLPGFDIAKPRQAHTLPQLTAAIQAIVEETSPGRKVTLMLHDWGCMFGYEFAMRHPELVSRIIGVDVGDAGSREQVRALGRKNKALVVFYQRWLALAWRIGGRIGDWMTRAMARALGCPSDIRFISSGMNYPYAMQWSGAYAALRRRLVLPGPLLFIYGTKKPFMFHSKAWADGVATQAGCKVLPLEASHWVMRDQAGPFNDAVLAWLESKAT
ncbi:MAG TPA: alpha/beta hydrolase [Albitalea sp.]|nr:alpha/beta hydrolase [Albitalea sp.]